MESNDCRQTNGNFLYNISNWEVDPLSELAHAQIEEYQFSQGEYATNLYVPC